ncbi:hypothetical protein A2160_01380 [Candidatus Beckwithbacteria bacterium RBG_13_42_9]|uniref:Uncharacterized protein n=1 Tax=Candidatus Beckwithbacteria bacterium RBG_13_42_9 TaxID=1797457 RepID=A0A1F5E495_9BACT|nr:MAG: hypothetical protein A2160_01380 [Candidatus Beckwithbacteria bacterium RBG_13_42_9]
MSAPKTNINLLPKNELEKTSLGKFFKWALTFGKYIVIVTQLIVIVAFLFRFKLDQDLDGLNERISQQQQVVSSYQDLEQEVRVLQDRLSALKDITNEQTLLSLSLGSLNQVMPLEVGLTSLTLNKSNFTLEGRSLSEVGLATLVYGLQNQPIFDNIVVRSVSTGGAKDPTLSFALNANIIKKGEKKSL